MKDELVIREIGVDLQSLGMNVNDGGSLSEDFKLTIKINAEVVSPPRIITVQLFAK